MEDYPKFGTAPIKCGRRKCSWVGFETDLEQTPMAMIGLSATQSACPLCGCESYSFLRGKELAEFEKLKALNAPVNANKRGGGLS